MKFREAHEVQQSRRCGAGGEQSKRDQVAVFSYLMRCGYREARFRLISEVHIGRTSRWLQDATREIPTRYKEPKKKFARAVINC